MISDGFLGAFIKAFVGQLHVATIPDPEHMPPWDHIEAWKVDAILAGCAIEERYRRPD